MVVVSLESIPYMWKLTYFKFGFLRMPIFVEVKLYLPISFLVTQTYKGLLWSLTVFVFVSALVFTILKQNHRISGVGKDLKRSSSPTKAGALQ